MSELNQEEQQQEEVRENSEQDTLKLGVSRRTFIGTGMTAAAAALVLPRQAIADDLCDDPNNNLDLDPTPGQDFMQPIVVEPNSPINLSATCVRAANGDITRRFCYNDQKMLPGPTFRVSPGSELNIEYKNELPDNFPQNLAPGADAEKVNITNLHFHGLHVSPLSLDSNGTAVSGNADHTIESSSDDVLVELEPNSLDPITHTYNVHIPAEHAPGTHWYHPHVHGSTAVQVINGMAGAIIIEEADPYVPQDQDFVWVIQGVGDGSGIYDSSQNGNINQKLMVNGQTHPCLNLHSNKMYRLRLINATATPGGFIKLKFQKFINGDYQDIVMDGNDQNGNGQNIGFYRVAVDGISHYGMPPQPVDSDGWDMSPGNRADFLVLLNEGNYRVRIEPNDDYNGNFNPKGFDGCDINDCAFIAKINVSDQGDPPTNVLPVCIDRPSSWGEDHYLSGFSDDCVPHVSRIIKFSAASGQGKINDEVYGDDNVPEFNVGIDTEEIWELKNVGLLGSAHPFHIHVNPFQVIEIDEDPNHEYKNIWFDTFFVPKNKPVKIRHRFKDYVGKFVFHCHILLHEDRGMMRNINVTGCGKGPGSNGGMINWPDNGTQADSCPGGVGPTDPCPDSVELST